MSDNDGSDKNLIEKPATGATIALKVRCGNCFHFEREKAQGFKDICKQLGVLEVSRPCSMFLPNVRELTVKTEHGKGFADILREIPSAKLSMYAALINQEASTRRQGFKYGQTVYIKLFPGEFLSNYVQAKVLLAQRGRVVVQGSKTNFGGGSFLKSSLLSEDEFLQKKKALIARKRIMDPKLTDYTTWRPKIEIKALKEYEPPTIDHVPVKRPKPKPKENLNTDSIAIRGRQIKSK